MKQYKLTEQEARELATKFAMRMFGAFGGKTLPQWIEEYMDEYNKVMEAVDAYNQSVSD